MVQTMLVLQLVSVQPPCQAEAYKQKMKEYPMLLTVEEGGVHRLHQAQLQVQAD
jgi:hypothetical protein